MRFVSESPEHHLLTYIGKIKARPQGWLTISVNFSEKFTHTALICDQLGIKKKCKIIQDFSFKAAQIAAQILDDVNDCVIYQFSDGDVLVLGRPVSPKEQQLFKEARQKLDKMHSDIAAILQPLTGDMYNMQKMIDARLLAARCVDAYMAMADINKCKTIPIRREKREEPMVMIVEDDQFTGTYASNIVSAETESVLVKNGEDAIIQYIEKAPDIVFLDIHLPGISGHQALEGIMKVDPEAHVIMLSVDAVKQSIIDAYKMGASGFLKKPFSKERLLFSVGRSPYINRPFIGTHPISVDMDDSADHTIN